MKQKKPKQSYPLSGTQFSTLWNYLYGLFQLLLFYQSGSFWYLSLGVFFLVLSISRFLLLNGRWKLNTMKNISAFLILILSITLCVQTYLVIENRINPVRDLILLIGQAAYCFTMIGIAISHLVLSHRKKELKEVILKDLSLVSAIASMLSLQRAMLGTFTRQDNGFIMKMEAASGAGAFLVFLLIALHLFRAKENPQD